MKDLPNISQALFERTFPRTSLLLSSIEREKLLAHFPNIGDPKEWQRVPTYLSSIKWPGGRCFLPDLARLELLLRKTILAPVEETRGFENVAMATEPDWYRAKFRFDSASEILDSDWPLDEIHARPLDSHHPGPCTLLIYREHGKPLFRRLNKNEGLLLRSLSLGLPLGRVLEHQSGPDFDAMTFHRWIESGLLRAIDWPPA